MENYYKYKNTISKRVVLIKSFAIFANIIGHGIGHIIKTKFIAATVGSLTCRPERTFVGVITAAQSKVKRDYELDLLNPNIHLCTLNES